jgi:glucose-1-phosphate adenylyltransferase
MAYIFQGDWEDIGTVRAFFEANLALTDTVPPYNFFNRLSPIYTRPRFLPASKVNAATIRRAIVGDGCIISDAHIERAVIGIRSIIESGATIRNSVIMGADYYEDEAFEAFQDAGPRPPIGIGRNSVIDRAIIDKNARIGESVVITPDGKAPNVDSTNYYIRDGVVVIPKNAVIPNGTWI